MSDDISNLDPLPAQSPPNKKKVRLWVSVVSLLIGFLALCFISMLALLGSDSGTEWVLKRVAAQQHMLTYHYVTGNFQNGVILDHVKIELVSTDITAKRINVRFGWRSILQGQVHLIHTTIDDLVVFNKTPSTGKLFRYSPINMPVVLRVNNSIVNGLTIQQIVKDPQTDQLSTRIDVFFSQIKFNKASWKGDLLTIVNSSIENRGFTADHVTGTMQFSAHYPIRASARASLPLLDHIGSPYFQVDATGDLEQIHGVVSAIKAKETRKETLTGTLKGTVDIRSMDHVFAMKGQVHWSDLHWPIITEQNLYSKSGSAIIQSTPHGLGIDVNTDLVGEYVPVGQYVVKLFTDYRKLDIQSIYAKAAKGIITGYGQVDWQKDVQWFVQGQLTGVQVAQVLPLSVLPYASYLPTTLTGPFRQTALISPHKSQIGVSLIGATGEHWRVGIARLGSLTNNTLPLAVDVQWENLSRVLAGVGQVNTQRGEAVVMLNQKHVALDANLDVLASPKLPAGHYTAKLTNEPTGLNIPSFTFNGDAGAVNASAHVIFAMQAVDKKPEKPMTWTADIATKGLDVSTLLESPIRQIQGTIHATGVSSSAQDSIMVQPALTGILKTDSIQSNPSSLRDIVLSGRGEIVLTKNTAKNTLGLKAYTAKFNGDLKSSEAPSGKLVILVSGTPDLTKIERFEHNGAAGQISATGQVITKNGVQWSATGKLNHFNLGFFLPSYPSVLTGAFNTNGQWSATLRHIQVAELDVSGLLKNKPLLAKGTLDAVFDPKSITPFPEKLKATNFLLDWAGNRLSANGGTSTNAHGVPVGSFNIQIDAKNLGQIRPDMSGRIFGTLDLSGNTQSPDTLVNINVENFKYSTLVIKNASLIGRIPQLGLQPSQLTLTVNDFRHDKQLINNISAKISGTQHAHVLDLSAKTPKTQLSIQLAGGLDAQMNWIGEIRQGMLSDRKMTLRQDKPAVMQYQSNTKMVTVAPHCWSGAGRFCIVDPLVVSRETGHVALTLDELDLSNFHDLMPSGMVWLGKLQGKATASWQANSPAQLSAEISTENGFIGLDAEDPQDPPSTLPYQRLSLLVSTQVDGIKLRFDAKTSSIGTGYIDALIDPKAEGKTINGALVLDNVQLQVLKPFFPGFRVLSGVASLAGGMSGPLTSPNFYGNLNLNNGKVVAVGIPLNLHDINLTSEIRGSQASINGQFMSGDGAGTLTGLASWVDQPVINLKLAGKELNIRQPPMVMVTVSPALDIQILPVDKQVNITGRVDVPHGVISPGVNSSKAVSKSSDVRIVHLDQTTTDAVLQNMKVWMINMDVNVVIGNDLRFRGFGANARIDGNLMITQRGYGGLMATGQISLEPNAKVEAYGQELALSKSNVIFRGSLLEPKLDIEADKVIDSRTVGLIIQGLASNPKISTWNNAGLTDQETYSAILSGYISTTSNLPSSTINNTALIHADVDNALAAAGISAGLSGSRNLTNQLGGIIGLSNLTFGADGSDGETKVNVTGYLSPKLYVRYGVGVFTPVNKLTLRYQMSQRFYMEASSSIERAIDFFYSWRF
jgi:translocation and assembly module TamB